jgi:hypothetical protein
MPFIEVMRDTALQHSDALAFGIIFGSAVLYYSLRGRRSLIALAYYSLTKQRRTK